MRSFASFRVGCSVIAAASLIAALPWAAAAQTAPAEPAPPPAPAAASAVVAGMVRGGTGSPVAGAAVTISGPATVHVTSDANGAFSAGVPPGIYRIAVSKAGFNSAILSDLIAVAGTSTPVTVSLSQVDLSSLRTIGTVTSISRGGGSAINTGAATSSFVGAQTFANLANPQVNDVLQRIPDVTIQHLGSQPDTTIIVGGAQPYETQILIDGHPLALGQYGVWTSQYFPSYLIGGAETQSGPGNTTPFANIAVGGTVNLLSPAFTQKQTAELVAGVDSFQSQYSNFITTGSAGKLAYVVDAGTGGNNGPYYQQTHCAVLADNGGAGNNLPGNTGIVQFCGDTSGSLLTRGETLKLRYNFTPSTSFEAGFVGAWGTYSPQGSAWGNSLGLTTIEKCLGANPLECTSPANANLIGQTIEGYSWYPGTFVYNNQTLFDGQFRTSLGNNTLLVRPYVGVIEPEIIDGLQEGGYASFFSPPGTVPSLAPGVQIPSTGLVNPNTFESTECPPGNIFSFSQINSPQNTLVSKNGQEECFQYPYTTFEQDKLYGSTFSLLHPIGDSLLNFTYDFHGQSTFAYFNAPDNISVPLSTDRYSTFSLTGDLHVAPKISLNAGLYDTIWSISGVQPLLSDGNPVIGPDGVPLLTGLGRHISRFDPHVALVARPSSATSLRAAWGTSATFPYVGQVSGNASYQPYAQSAPLYTAGILTEKNPSLEPEVSLAYDLGADHRFPNGSVFSGDLQDTIIHNVFQALTLAEAVPDSSSCFSAPCIEGVSTPINVARLRTEMATLKYRYAPPVGFGFNIAAAAVRSIVDGIPLAAYNSSPAFPVNNAQICGNGLFTPGIPTCIPYLKGYGQLTYSARGGTYAALGVDYEGKNNAYYQPPFVQVDLTVRRPVTRSLELLMSVQNVLNTNNFMNLPAPNAGVALTAQTNTGLVSYPSTLIPAPPRTVRVQMRLHMGR
jgi:hypothetical protein